MLSIWYKTDLVVIFLFLNDSYLRDMLYNNAEITKYFSDATMHVLDYDFEYIQGYMDPEKFPEYSNKVFPLSRKQNV